jgi:hypothetical protein
MLAFVIKLLGSAATQRSHRSPPIQNGWVQSAMMKGRTPTMSGAVKPAYVKALLMCALASLVRLRVNVMMLVLAQEVCAATQRSHRSLSPPMKNGLVRSAMTVDRKPMAILATKQLNVWVL